MKYIIVPIMFFLSFTSLNAQVVISEVMYSLEGADDKHEWIEIFNSGASGVDLTDWRFNDGSNHKLNVPPEKGGQGSIVIQAGEYAILTGNADTFLIDHPSFSGTVIDTVMSLNNVSDTLSLINSDSTTEDSVTYTSEQGADEDGNSLQLISESWSVVTPTPGVQNESSGGSEESEQEEESSQSEESSSNSSSSNTSQGSSFPIEQQIFADAGGDRNTIVGADSLFEGKALGLQKKPLANARYVWNFGNGETKEGQNVLHYYQYPGEYVVILNVSSGQYSASDRIVVNAYPAELIISKVDKEFIEIHNKSNHELNLSWWQLQSAGERFIIPRDTIILSDKKLIFSSDVTGLDTSVEENVSLLYPNGVEAVSFFQIKIPQKVIATKSAPPSAEPIQPIIAKANPVQEKESEKQIEESQNDTTQTASVISSFNNSGSDNSKNSGMSKWLLAIFSIIVVSAGSIIFIGKPKKESGDEIEIVE